MGKIGIVVGIVIVSLCCPLTSQAIEMYGGPLEYLCAKSELIVLVRFLSAAPLDAAKQAETEKILAPGQFQRDNYVMKSCSFEILETIKGGAPADTKLSAISYFPIPGKPEMGCPKLAPFLIEGKQHLLLLSRLAPGKEFYVSPSYGMSNTLPSADEIAEVRQAANPDRWPWSKSLGGLSIAMRAEHYHAQGGLVCVKGVLFVQNQSERDIVLDLTKGSTACIEVRDAAGATTMPETGHWPRIVVRWGKSTSNPPTSQPEDRPGIMFSSGSRLVLPPGAIAQLCDDSIVIKEVGGTARGILEVQASTDSPAWSGRMETAEYAIKDPPPATSRPD